MIPAEVERRARWVLDTLGARDLGLGDDVPYVEAAWEQVERGERPAGDDLAEAFFHLARIEELGAPLDRHGRFSASESCLDPLDPPLERLRARLGLDPPRWHGARFAVALTHDVDTPWRWTGIGLRGAAARLRDHARAGRMQPALREARGLAGVPMHRLRGTDPNWRFDRLLRITRARGSSQTFFLMAGHRHPADGAAPAAYERLRPRLVETLLEGGAEIGLHGSYTAADDLAVLADEKRRLEALAGPVGGHRFHYLRVDPHRNLPWLAAAGLAYDTTLGFADRPGFRAGIAQPFRPWDHDAGRPLDLVEIPLALMDVTLAEERYLGLSARAAERHVLGLVSYAAAHGGGFSVLWHNDRFDPTTSRGWDRLYLRLIDAVRAAGGVCLSAGELAEEARTWLP
ncbi:MAG: polysaccharide deacetylase family protein [Gaiellales bacterium]